MVPYFDPANLFNIEPTNAAGVSAFLPFGYVGIWADFPYAIWFYLAIEGLPLAAEETREPAQDVPKGFIAAMFSLPVLAGLILIFAPGGAGAARIQYSGALLIDAIASPHAYGGTNWLSSLINVVGLTGLIASFFSTIYAYSRQNFALSRAGYLPKALSLTSSNRVPWVALVLASVVATIIVDPVAAGIMAGVYALFIAYFGLYSHHLVAQAPEEEEFATLEQAESELAGS